MLHDLVSRTLSANNEAIHIEHPRIIEGSLNLIYFMIHAKTSNMSQGTKSVEDLVYECLATLRSIFVW